MNPRRHRIIALVGAAVFLFGIAIVPGWGLVGWIRGPERTASMQFPLGHLEDVAVDSQGRIFVAEGIFHRVQRYSRNGTFERGWFVPTAGVFALRTTSDGRVMVATARANKLLTYSPDGELLHEVRDGKAWYREYAAERETTGNLATRGGLLPRVTDAGTGRTVVATPWPLLLIAAPFPAVLYSAVGVALVGLHEWRRRRGKPR